jgi:hypothetical protein
MGNSYCHGKQQKTKNRGGVRPPKRKDFFHKHDGDGGAHENSQQRATTGTSDKAH